MPPGPTKPFARATNSISYFAARGAVQSCSGAEEDAIDNVRGPTPHASRVNWIVSVVMIPWRFTYLCWNIPSDQRRDFRIRIAKLPCASQYSRNMQLPGLGLSGFLTFRRDRHRGLCGLAPKKKILIGPRRNRWRQGGHILNPTDHAK